MPDQPADAMLAAARAYALSIWTYDPADYRSPEHRDVHINADARGTAQAPWFVALWEAGIAEGRRQATEGLEREWALNGRGWSGFRPFTDEAQYRAHAAVNPEVTAVSRLVGPWEPADPPQQPEPERFSGCDECPSPPSCAGAVRCRLSAERPEPGVGWRLARDEEIQAAAEQPASWPEHPALDEGQFQREILGMWPAEGRSAAEGRPAVKSKPARGTESKARATPRDRVALVGPAGRCGCCHGTGEHRCGHECDSCDGSGRDPDSPVCRLPHGADCRCAAERPEGSDR